MPSEAMAKTVLVVEESAAMQRVVGFILQSAGYRVLQARDCADAQAKLDGARVDMVICDLSQAEVDDLAFVRGVRSRSGYGTVPIVVLAGAADGSKLLWGQHAGTGAWVIKPFHPDQLLAVVGKLMAA